MKPFPPRLHVLMAREARTAVIVRRGPSKQVCSVGWDREHDEFQMGQWLKARIFERRCDLSPDGKYMIYFALDGKWNSETRGSYSAICRAPYLKAIALFAKGDAWNGGGLFTGPASYWLNGAAYHTTLRDTTELRRQESTGLPDFPSGECPGVYYPRLQRDGWKYVSRDVRGKWNKVDTFEKPAGHGWVLRKLAHVQIGAPLGKGCYWDEHRLDQTTSGVQIAFPGWEWAEVDGNRLVWAEQGKLYAGALGRQGIVDQSLLRDFRDITFEPITAPY